MDYDSVSGVTVALVPWKEDDVQLRRVEIGLHPEGCPRPLWVARQLAGPLLRCCDWTGIAVCYVEQPFGPNRNTIASLSVIQGAILSALPAHIACSQIKADEWKKIAVGAAKASKEDVFAWAVETLGFGPEQSQHDADAAAIAWAAREESRRASSRRAA